MLHTGVKLGCAACLPCKFYVVSYIVKYNTRFVFETKASITAPAENKIYLQAS